MESPSTPTIITLAELLSSRFAPVQDVMLSIFLGRVDSFFPGNQKKRLVLVATSHHSEANKAFLALEGYTEYTLHSERQFKVDEQERVLNNSLFLVDNSPVYQRLSNQFVTTLLQNFATWKKIYSLFPFPTFLNREGYLLNCMNRKTGRAPL
jgi:hypothetical protein